LIDSSSYLYFEISPLDKQAIGVLKSRWTILCDFALRLRTKHDQALAHGVMVACVILHNLVVSTDDEPLDDDKNANAEACHATTVREISNGVSIAMEEDGNFDLDEYEVW